MTVPSRSDNLRSHLQRFVNALTDRQWLILFFCVIVAAKLVWISYADGPIVFGDEYYFKSLAQSFLTLTPLAVDGKITFAFAPIYPLVLTPALFFGDGWYRGMLILNALFSSTLVFPVAWIARRLLPRVQSWVCVWLAALIPYHVIYPRLLMTENLFLALFLVSIGFVLTDPSRIERHTSLLIGVIWGVTCLTRYVFLPVVPVLAVLWWVQPTIAAGKPVWADARRKLTSLAWAMAGVCIFVVPWFSAGYLTQAATDATAASAAASQELGDLWVARTLTTWNGALLIWLVLYLAYVVLMSGPFLPAMTMLPLTLRRMSPSGRFFAAALICVTGALVVVSANYMATLDFVGSSSIMEGRYVMPVLPLLPILTFVVFQSAGQISTRLRRAWLLVDFLIVVLLVSIGYYIDILHGPWSLPPWFSSLPWVAPDTTAFNEMRLGPLNIGFIGLAFILMAVGFAWVAWRPRHLVLGVAVVVSVFYIADSAYTGSQMWVAQEQSRIGKIVAALSGSRPDPNPVLVVLDANVPIPSETVATSLAFWNIPRDSVVVKPASAMNPQIMQNLGFIVTQSEYPNSLRQFTVGENTYGVYEWPIKLSGPPLVIERFGPTETAAGQGFNIQPNGESALWVMADNLSPGVILVFGESELPTVSGDANVVTAAIPNRLFSQPGVIQLWLRDPITQRTSNVVQFVIKGH